VYLLAGSLSALDTIYYPTSMALVPSLVDRKRLGAADTLAQGSSRLAAFSGRRWRAMISHLGHGASFGANAVLFLIATATFAAVLRITNRSQARANCIGQPE
jgi:hypothetical protein